MSWVGIPNIRLASKVKPTQQPKAGHALLQIVNTGYGLPIFDPFLFLLRSINSRILSCNFFLPLHYTVCLGFLKHFYFFAPLNNASYFIMFKNVAIKLYKLESYWKNMPNKNENVELLMWKVPIIKLKRQKDRKEYPFVNRGLCSWYWSMFVTKCRVRGMKFLPWYIAAINQPNTSDFSEERRSHNEQHGNINTFHFW